MNISNRTLFAIITVLLSCIIFFVPDPLHLNIIRAALVVTMATFIAVSKNVRWISLEIFGLLLLATSFIIAVAGYVGGTYDFLLAGAILAALTLILISMVYMARKLQAHSVPVHIAD